MTDREKIMNDFEHEVNKAHGEGWDFVDLSTDDAKKILVLLKEQEPKQVVMTTNSYGTKFYHCPRCNHDIYAYPRQMYCSQCGQAVKWDD